MRPREMDEIIIGEQYRWGSAGGPVVTVWNKHHCIDNHYYIKFEVRDSFDTTRRELLFPIGEDI